MTQRSAPEGQDKPSLGRRMKRSLGKTVPARESLASHPLLRPVARQLLAPHLWHLQHEAVARGVAIGAFWAFALPFGQRNERRTGVFLDDRPAAFKQLYELRHRPVP